ncbi:MAG: hypothetical protein PWP23_3261 [Candidatus Sumerlaeota bacterium]|nr:hypothetical protein [Candidatus Sumerlaeota bacterium]
MSRNVPGVLMTALMPHPPVIVPGVGRGRERQAARTVAAMGQLAQRIVRSRPDTLVVISPHSPRKPGRFGLWADARHQGSLAMFRADHERVDLPNDLEFVRRFATACAGRGLRTWDIRGEELDHGALVPLCYLRNAGWDGPTVITGLNYPGEGELEEFGEALHTTAAVLRRRVVVLASGDMSHRLTVDAPGGYHPDAQRFDAAFVQAVERASIQTILNFDANLRAIAGEDVVDASIVAIAAREPGTEACELMSYEGPFGVGYSIAVFSDLARAPRKQPTPKEILREKFSLARIARRAVEDHLHHRTTPLPADPPSEFQRPAGVFVTIRTIKGELRGCIGTLEANYPTIVEETIDRAAAAAFRDPRFDPVRKEELPNLLFEVSVLHPAEPVESEDELDPARYGVIVSGNHGRRAVMLPGIDQLDTAAKQLEATRRKAGIPEGEAVRIERFAVEKHVEKPPL